MADITLTNNANISGTYDSSPLTLESNTVTTQLISGITIQKSVDKQNWLSGDLTYTITIQNNADSNLDSPVLTDILNPDLIKLVENSVQVDGAIKQYTYEELSGTLTVNLDNIDVGNTATITFRVQKK